MNRLANDKTASRQERALAVFGLFATYVHPNTTAGDLRRVLTDLTWLNQTVLREVRYWFGPIVLDWRIHESMFTLTLFPLSDAGAEWTIYFCLSGEQGALPEAKKFLHGDESLTGSLRLTQFALFSRQGHMDTRLERFTSGTVTVEKCHYDIEPAVSSETAS